MAGGVPTPGITSGVVFQQPRLFPWRTVGGNVERALKYAKVPRERWAQRRDQLLARVGLEGTAGRRIWEISGGQQQRVAMLMRSRRRRRCFFWTSRSPLDALNPCASERGCAPGQRRVGPHDGVRHT